MNKTVVSLLHLKMYFTMQAHHKEFWASLSKHSLLLLMGIFLVSCGSITALLFLECAFIHIHRCYLYFHLPLMSIYLCCNVSSTIDECQMCISHYKMKVFLLCMFSWVFCIFTSIWGVLRGWWSWVLFLLLFTLTNPSLFTFSAPRTLTNFYYI